MTREEILRMAQEAGFLLDEVGFIIAPRSGRIGWKLELERFALNVAAAMHPETAIAEAYRRGWEAGATATRDACIALCDEHWKHNGNAMECADSIRAMGKK